MLRAALTIGGTVAGLAALLSFRTHTLAAAAPDAASTPAASTGTSQPMTSGTGSSSPSPAASKTGKAGTTADTGAGAGASAAATPTASTATSAAPRTVTGSVASTQFGPMQVQVTLDGTKITNVTVLQRTNDGATSDQIDANAIPKLNSETLAAQSASIQAVSGASYTSMGYIQSLQSALDKAGA